MSIKKLYWHHHLQTAFGPQLNNQVQNAIHRAPQRGALSDDLSGGRKRKTFDSKLFEG